MILTKNFTCRILFICVIVLFSLTESVKPKIGAISQKNVTERNILNSTLRNTFNEKSKTNKTKSAPSNSNIKRTPSKTVKMKIQNEKSKINLKKSVPQANQTKHSTLNKSTKIKNKPKSSNFSKQNGEKKKKNTSRKINLSEDKNKITKNQKENLKKNKTSKLNISFEQLILDRHNMYRAKHKARPLVLNSKISKVSLEWANFLRKKTGLYHRPKSKYGENLFLGWSSNGASSINVTDAVDMWYAEKKKYKYDDTTPNIQETGHFTQVIWKSSRELGIGVVQFKENVIVVCNYYPPGNVKNQFTKNVIPAI